MAKKNQEIKNKEAFIRVREILAKNKSNLGKATLMAFVALGLFSLAFPVALPAGIAALGIGAIGIFLDQVTQENLSEKEILDGVQKILDNNGLLQQKGFFDYMAPFYPKLLQINETLDSFATKEDLIKEIDPLLPKLNEISEKIDLLVTKEDFKNAVTELKKDNPEQSENDKLKAAQDKLNGMPLDHIPEPAALPEGSRFPNIRPNPKFIGRDNELKRLATLMESDKTDSVGVVVALSGMGGIGKTQLAAEFCHRYGQYFAGGVYWLDFSNPELINSEVADCYGFDKSQSLEEKIRRVKKEWFSQIPRLLIFDNCENQTLSLKWCPSSGCSRIIITTRQGNWGVDLDIERIPVDILQRDQSIKLLQGFRKEINLENPEFDFIAEELGDLPLALHLAGSYLGRYQHEITLSQYLERLKIVTPIKHESMQTGDFSPTGHDLDVGRTFSVSIDRLEKEKIPLQILEVVAIFAPGIWIPRWLLRINQDESLSDIKFSDGIQLLTDLGLIEQNESGEIKMHRLVSYYVNANKTNSYDTQKLEAIIEEYISTTMEKEHMEEILPLLPHVKIITERALIRKDEISAHLASTLAAYLHSSGDFINAKEYYQKALDIIINIFGEEDLKTALCLNNLGWLLHLLGDSAGAEQNTDKAYKISKKILGENDPSTLRMLNNYAGFLQEKLKFDEARIIYERILKSYEINLGFEHPDTLTILNNLGGLHQEMGDYDGALTIFERTLLLRQKVLGEEHQDTALSYSNLGFILQIKKDFEKAEENYKKSLEIRKRLLGEKHYSIAESLNNLGYLMQAQGKYYYAKKYFIEALEILKNIGENIPLVATVNSNLGDSLASLGKLNEAKNYFEKAVKIRQSVLGENHPITVRSLNHLADLLNKIEDFEGAIQCYLQLIEISKDQLGVEHQTVGKLYNSLGFLYKKTQKFEDANYCYGQAISINTKVLGTDHPDTILCLNNLGELLQATGKYNQARSLLEQVVDSSKKINGIDHKTTAMYINNLGRLLQAMGEQKKALIYLEQALSINRKVMGEDDLNNVFYLFNIGFLLKEVGQNQKAKAHFNLAFDIKNRIGEDNKIIMRDLFSVGSLFQESGNLTIAIGFYNQLLEKMKKTLGEDHPTTLKMRQKLESLKI